MSLSGNYICFFALFHYDNTPMQYTVVFTAVKNDKFQLKISKHYTPVNPKFTIQKLGVRGSTSQGHVSRMYYMQLCKNTTLPIHSREPIGDTCP